MKRNILITCPILRDVGLKLKLQKCSFMQDDVEYLGDRINREGIAPLPEEVKAIHEAPPPTTLEGIFAQTKPIPFLVAARLHPLLSAYSYDFKYKKGSEHSNADALSRLPLSNMVIDDEEDETYVTVNLMGLDRSPVTSEEVKRHSRRDRFINKVIDCILCNRLNELNKPVF